VGELSERRDLHCTLKDLDGWELEAGGCQAAQKEIERRSAGVRMTCLPMVAQLLTAA
jgi:hypothetical protein